MIAGSRQKASNRRMHQRHVLPASGSGLKVATEVLPEHKGNTERDYANSECALESFAGCPPCRRHNEGGRMKVALSAFVDVPTASQKQAFHEKWAIT